MPGVVVGSVAVTIVPDASRFNQDLQAGLAGPIQQVTRRLTSAIGDAIRDGMSNAPTGAASRSGDQAGARFAQTFKARIEEALQNLPDIEVNADTTDADAHLFELRTQLEDLSRQRIGIDINEATARAELDRIKAELDEVAADSPDITVHADIARAQAALAEIQAQVDELGSQSATVTVSDGGSVGAVGAGLGGLSSLLVAIAPLAIPAGAALAAAFAGAATVIGSLAGALGVAGLAIAGVSKTVGLLDQEQKAAASSAGSTGAAVGRSAAQQASAAAQVEQAQRALKSARQNADDAAISSAEAVANARRSLADAETRAAQQQRQALEQVQSAEYSLAQANQQSLAAQQALNDAREQAQRDLMSYADNAADANLTVQQAQLDLINAQDAYQAGVGDQNVSQVQQQQNALNVAKAQQALVEAQQRLQQATEDNTKAQAQGVAGAPGVVAAAQQVANAKHDQQQATRQLADAERQAAQQQKDSAEQVAKAQQAVSDAVRAQVRQQRQSADSIANAQASVASAMRSVQEASISAGAAGSGALAGIQAELAKVNPTTLRFAEFVKNTLSPALTGLQDAAAAGLLPGVEAGIKTLMPVLPALTGFVRSLAKTMGDLFEEAAKALTSPFWTQFFAWVSRTAGPTLTTFVHIVENIGTGFAGMLEAFGPIVTGLGKGLETLTGKFADFGKHAGDKNSPFQAFLSYVAQVGPTVADLFEKLAGIAGKLIVALAPLGAAMVTALDGVARLLDKLSPDQLLALAGGIAAVAGIIFGGPISIAVAVVAAAGLIVSNWGKIAPHIKPVLDLFTEVWGFIKNKLVPVLTGIFKDAWDGIKGALGIVGHAIGSHQKQLGELKDAFAAIADFIVTKVLPVLGPVLKDAFKLIGISIAATIDTIAFLVSAFNGLLSAGKAVGKWFSGPFVSFFTGAWHGIVRIWDDITGAFSSALHWITSNWGPKWAAIKNVLTAPVRLAFTTIRNLWDDITGAFSSAWHWLTDNWGPKWAAIKNVLTAPVTLAKNAITGLWGDIVNSFKGIPARITAATKGMWDGIKNEFRAALNWIIGKWNGLDFTIGGWQLPFPPHTKFPSVTIGTPDIPLLATGGLTQGITPAIIGDNPSGQELIMPMDSPHTVDLLANAMRQATYLPGVSSKPLDKGLVAQKTSGGMTQNIYPRANQSEYEIGVAAAAALGWQMKGRP